MRLETIADLAAFVVRCVAAALLAYLLASVVRLPHPLWACIFALITSQDSASAPFIKTVGGRVVGTIIGVIVAVAVGVVASRTGLAVVLQLAAAVLICALFAWRRPAIHLCLWTAPIVLRSATPAESIITVGFDRGCEVVIGVLNRRVDPLRGGKACWPTPWSRPHEVEQVGGLIPFLGVGLAKKHAHARAGAH